jgi:Fic family protein
LERNFSSDTAQRALQMQHLAHIEVQEAMEQRLGAQPAAKLCSTEFLCWLHAEFYQRLPDSLRQAIGMDGSMHMVTPGQLRDSEVSVGRHMAPARRHLLDFLSRFAEFYGPRITGDPAGLVAAAAAHHRLLWIHPFLDGNGRVSRLFSHAWFASADAASDGLWTLARGFARRHKEYRESLANADQQRVNDLDGRGFLSERSLRAFCEFFLNTAIDQVNFMRQLLDLDGLLGRITAFAESREGAGVLSAGAAKVLREVFLRGEIPRGDVHRVVGVSARTAQKLTGQLLDQRLVRSPSPKGPLRLEFPALAAGFYFPELYPAGSSSQSL